MFQNVLNVARKIFGVGLLKISPKIKEWFQVLLTKVLDFFEKHFNNIIKHLYGVGGAGLGFGLVANLSDSIQNGAISKFSYFSRVLGLNTLFANLSNKVSPYMTNWDTSFIEAFSAFGCIDAINTIINSCAYALLFWLAVVVFKWVLGLLPMLMSLLAKI